MPTNNPPDPRAAVTSASPQEISDFWAHTLDRLRTQPLNPKAEEVTQKETYHKYRVTYMGLDGVPVRAYLSIPWDEPGRGKKGWPAIVQGPGYGGQGWMHDLGDATRGYAILNVYPRGQGESAELWKVNPGAEQAWINHGRAHQEGFYYQGGYTDLSRGVDYLLTRPDIDPQRIGAMGSSQGGLLALALGAVDQRINAVVAHVPFLCDFRHSAAQAGTQEISDQALMRVWDFFEPLNLAPRIAAATLLSSGGRDTTCPPATIHAVYDRLPGVKALAHYPDMAHTASTPFSTMAWQWMDRYLG